MREFEIWHEVLAEEDAKTAARVARAERGQQQTASEWERESDG
jgi:hypothetical protein